MTDYGLKRRRYPEEESLHLDGDLQICAETVGLLTNFQIEALRFLWTHNQNSQRCLYNDGRHMGKRITLVALITALIRTRGQRVLIACDSNETIVSWLFKLKVLGDASHDFSIYTTAPGGGGRGRKLLQIENNNCPITLTNFTQFGLNLNKVILQGNFNFIVLDIGGADECDLKLSLDLPSNVFVVVVYSPDIASRPKLLHGLLANTGQTWQSIRRTNENYLREFPWLDQRQLKVKFEEWRGHRTTSDILAKKDVPSIKVEDEDEAEKEDEQSEQDNSEVSENTPVKDPQSQVMSQLLFETDDEVTPVKTQFNPQRSPRSCLLSSMYLRVSQSFANTPQQRTIAATIAQDSPDLFASILNDREENPVDSLVVDRLSEEVGEDTYSSPPQTPVTIRDAAIPSQSSISVPSTSLRFEVDEEDPDRSDVFEITTNEVFATKIKISTSQKYVPVDDVSEQLKFTAEETMRAKQSPRTPRKTKRQAGSTNTTPTSGGSAGWLSKRDTPKKPTPEKVLAKKRKSMLQFYATNGSGSKGVFRSNLDFAVLDDDDHTQRWNACELDE